MNGSKLDMNMRKRRHRLSAVLNLAGVMKNCYKFSACYFVVNCSKS